MLDLRLSITNAEILRRFHSIKTSSFIKTDAEVLRVCLRKFHHSFIQNNYEFLLTKLKGSLSDAQFPENYRVKLTDAEDIKQYEDIKDKMDSQENTPESKMKPNDVFYTIIFNVYNLNKQQSELGQGVDYI